jgi:hypothetical protein
MTRDQPIVGIGIAQKTNRRTVCPGKAVLAL